MTTHRMQVRSRRIAAVLLVAGVLAGCARPRDTAVPAGPEVRVTLGAVDSAAVARPVSASGLLAGKEELPLAFKIGGVVARVDVEAGDVVRPGQALASLELAEIGALVEKAKIGLDKAERDLARARALAADSVVTREMLENAQSARDAAAADVVAARFNARFATIAAPGAGVVLKRLSEPGATVAPGQPILYFASAAGGQVVRVGVPDRDVVRLAPGDAAVATFDAWPGREFLGRVTSIGAAAEPGVGTYEVELRLDEPVRLGGAAEASGLVADVVITPARRQPVKFVSIASLLEGDSERAHVWSLGVDGRPVRHDVLVAFLDGDRAAIASGLEGVREIVTGGAAYLTPESRTVRAGGATK